MIDFSCSRNVFGHFLKNRHVLAAAFISALVVPGGCSKESVAEKSIRRHFEEKDYTETVAMCKKALGEGVHSGKIEYYYGMSLVYIGRDYEGFNHLQKLYPGSALLAGKAAGRLLDLSREDLRNDKKIRASTRLLQASKLNASLDFGALFYLVAQRYYREREYSSAVHYFKKALEAFPDTSAAPAAVMAMAEAYTRLAMNQSAKASYREFLNNYSGHKDAGSAAWKLAELLLNEGKKSNRLGNFEEAVESMKELMDLTDNINMIQNAHFIMGEAYEGLAEFSSAYDQYKAVVSFDRGSSGAIIKKAVAKIEEFRQAGLDRD